ncbi:MAG: hypothetical protein EBQ66_00875 [Flavobacteriia bacterium]|nr:hypothetical protein [Flavobacteriia bacterium]
MAKTSSKSKQAQYDLYKSKQTWKANRERKLLRALQKNPGNAKQIEAAIKNITYRRKTPKTKVWSKTKIKTAQLMRQVCGSCPHDIFSSNQKVADQVLASLRTTFNPKTLGDLKVSFKLGDRLHGGI